MKQTFILFGQAGQNVAQGDSKFCRHLRRAFSTEYFTIEEAQQRLMEYCEAESDNYSFTDDGNAVQEAIGYDHEKEEGRYSTIMERGDMNYEYDSRTWSFILLEDLDEKDAAIVLRDNVLFDDTDKELLYRKYPDLRPVEEEE